jgi:hypothetical protein
VIRGAFVVAVWSGCAGSAADIDGARAGDAAATADTNANDANASSDASRRPTRPDGGAGTPSCANLPAGGAWERINPPGVQETDAIALDPFDPAVIYTTGRGVWRSSDCGGSWTRVSTGVNADMVSAGAPSAMVLDAVDRGTMYMSMYLGPQNLWKSTNGGVDWQRLIDPASDVGRRVQYFWFQSIALDPTDHLHLVASSHANCNPPDYSIGCQVESLDGGTTWSLVFNPERAGWAEQGGALALGPSLWIYGQPFGRLWITTDHGATWRDRTPTGGGGTSGGFLGEPAIGDDNRYYLPTLNGVIRSADGLTWETLPGLTGRFVGFAAGGGRIFASDQWSLTYRMASLGDLSHWTEIPAPTGLPSNQGGPHLRYEPTHRLLYSSNWAGGMWRTRIP